MSATFKDYLVSVSIYNLINMIIVLVLFPPHIISGFILYNIVLIICLLVCDKLGMMSVFLYMDKK